MRRAFPCCFFFLVLLYSCHSAKDVEQTAEPVPMQRIKEQKKTVAPALTDYQQRRYNELFLEAIRQKQAERMDAEYELLRAALKICPTASESVYEMALLQLSFTSYSDVAARASGDSLLHRAVELAPSNLYYKETLATYLANSARYAEAIALYEEIADAKPSVETLTTLIWLYKTSGDYPGVIRSVERIETLDGHDPKWSLEKFYTYLAMNDDEHAYKAIEDLCAEYPLDLRYRVLLGDLYNQQGYYERALDIYRDVLTAEPDNSYAQLSLLAYYKAADADSLYLNFLHKVVLNKHTQSDARLQAMRSYAMNNVQQHADSLPVVRLFQQILAQPQSSRDMAELYADYVQSRGLPEDSLVAALHRVLRIEPDYTKARLQLLQITLQRGDMNAVAKACREGELYDPAEATFYYYEGTALYRMGRDAAAIDALQRGTERVSETTDAQLSSDLYALLGDVLHDAGIKDEAYEAYDKALSCNPLNLICLNNYAYFLAQDRKDLSRAEQMSLTAVQAVGDDPTYLDTYAWILFLQGRYAEAQVYIDDALLYTDEEPANASTFDHAGDIYSRLGNSARALTLWRKALSLTHDKQKQRAIQRKIKRRRI